MQTRQECGHRRHIDRAAKSLWWINGKKSGVSEVQKKVAEFMILTLLYDSDSVNISGLLWRKYAEL